MVESSGWNTYKTGAEVTKSFSISKQAYYSEPQVKLTPLRVNLVSGSEIAEKCLINFLKNYTNPINDYTCYTLTGAGQFLTASSLFELIEIPLLVISKPRNVVLSPKKEHFLSLQ